MFICVDGISGAGKSHVLTEIASIIEKRGGGFHKYHFYSDSCSFGTSEGMYQPNIDVNLLDGSVCLEKQIERLEHICLTACKAFLNTSWDQSNTVHLFDRSPLTYLAYVAGGYMKEVKFTNEISDVIQILKPIVLDIEVVKAEQRAVRRDKTQRNDIVHGMNTEMNRRINDYFVQLGDKSWPVEVIPSEIAARTLIRRLGKF